MEKLEKGLKVVALVAGAVALGAALALLCGKGKDDNQ